MHLLRQRSRPRPAAARRSGPRVCGPANLGRGARRPAHHRSSRRVGGPEHLHPSGGLRAAEETRAVVVVGQGLQRHDLAGAQGLFRPRAVSGLACRYRQKIPGDVRVSRSLRQGVGARSQDRTPCPPLETIDPTLPPCRAIRGAENRGAETRALAKYGFDGLIAGIRRDEEATRAKERVFSPRGTGGGWDVRDQPPEFWDQFNASPPPGAHLRIHPILHWTEADIWAYTKRENIPIISALSRQGRQACYRSLGDQDITHPVASTASSIDEILIELDATKVPERAGRALDHETEGRLRAAACRRLSLENDNELSVPMNMIVSSATSATPNGTTRPQGSHRHRRPCRSRQVDPGRTALLHETGSLPEGKLEMLKTVSARRGMPFEWSFLVGRAADRARPGHHHRHHADLLPHRVARHRADRRARAMPNSCAT